MAKKKKSSKTISMPQNTEAMIRTRARNLELGACYINQNWEESKEAAILVTRKHKQGGTTIGVFLVDLAMQGLKDTFYYFNMSTADFHDFLDGYLNKQDHVEVDYLLVHNIIYESILFGEDNGYEPAKDFSVSQYILEEDTEDLEMYDIDFGFEEKPTWIDKIDDDEDIFTEYPHFEDQEENEYLSLVKALPNIQLDDISSETVDDETWEKRTDDWEIEDWRQHLEETKGQYDPQSLDFVTMMAYDWLNDFLDYDHFDGMFGRKIKRKNIRHKELDQMNEQARMALKEKRLEAVHKIYNGTLTFIDCFPQAKNIPVPSAADMCTILAEYSLLKNDLEDAASYIVVDQILRDNDFSQSAVNTWNQVIIALINYIKELGNGHQEDAWSGETLLEDVYHPHEKPNEGIWDDFYILCDEIFKVKPWETIYEDQVFGIRLPESEKLYFVSIMGTLGDHLSVTFYQGIEGVLQFWTFHKGIMMNAPDNLLLLNKIDVSWEDREMILPEQKAIIKKLGRKYSGKNAWPMVTQQIRGFVPFTPSEETMANIVIMLTQSLGVIKMQAKNKRLLDRTNFDDFTYLIRSLEESDTGKKWVSQVETLKTPKDRPYQLEVLEADLKRFEKLPVKWNNLEVGLNILPAPIKEEGTPGVFPFALLGVDPHMGIGVFMDTLKVETTYSEMAKKIPSVFIKQCIKTGGRPAKITISEIRLMDLALYLQENTSTKFDMVNEMPAHQDLLDSLLKSL